MTVETEVVAKARRRRFTAAEKLRVLREADGRTKPGELGALLRREGAVGNSAGKNTMTQESREVASVDPGASSEPFEHDDRRRLML